MSKLLLILATVFLITPFDTTISDYQEKINNGYQYYTSEEDYNEQFNLIITRGITNNTPSYGIMFYAMNPDTYSISFEINGKEYVTNPNNRGDYIIPAIDITKYENIKLIIYDSEHQEATSILNRELTLFTKEDIMASNYSTGEGNKIPFTTLRLKPANLVVKVMIYCSLVIITACSFILFIFFKQRRGFFSKSKRKEGIVDLREYIKDSLQEINDESDFTKDFQILDSQILDSQILDSRINESETDVLERDVSLVTVYTNPKKEEIIDNEIKETKDITQYLQEEGLTKQYKEMTLEEKNVVMILLMRLKDEGKITNTQYLEETYRLWKE